MKNLIENNKKGIKIENKEKKGIKTTKYSIKITSKMKKKLKYTQNKLKIDKIKLKKIIAHILNNCVGMILPGILGRNLKNLESAILFAIFIGLAMVIWNPAVAAKIKESGMRRY